MWNRKALYCLLVVAITAVVVSGCGQRSPASEPPSTPAAATGDSGASTEPTEQSSEPDRTGWPVIVAFGDSLTEGLNVDAKENYPSRLQNELDRLGYQYKVVNAGISGDTSQGGLNRIEAVLRHQPEIVILELGANDGLQGKPTDAMRQNLAKIIERLQAEGITVILAGMQIPPNYGPEYTQSFEQTFYDLAAEYELPLIPFFLEGVAAKPELNLRDGIHPTGEGYQYVVENVLEVLQPLLKLN